MTFTIMISTRDRVRDLQGTCSQLLKLEPPPMEVLICTDGCTDETCDTLARNFPQFNMLRNTQARGSVPSRDRMLRSARADIVVSLDDDSYPLRTDFLQRLTTVFDDHPEAAVVVFSERRAGMALSHSKSGRSQGRYVAAYANCGAAMRRKVYLNLPGFPIFFEHMYEEPDYAAQCYAAGYGVWFEPSLEIFHRQSETNRRVIQRHHLNARNELWSVWLRCPRKWLPLVTVYRAARQLVHACARGPQWVMREPAWWRQAFNGIGLCLEQRRAMPWQTYYRWMRLARRPVYSVKDLRAKFPTTPASAGGLSRRGGWLSEPKPLPRH